jgi:hypothetical protein
VSSVPVNAWAWMVGTAFAGGGLPPLLLPLPPPPPQPASEKIAIVAAARGIQTRIVTVLSSVAPVRIAATLVPDYLNDSF